MKRTTAIPFAALLIALWPGATRGDSRAGSDSLDRIVADLRETVATLEKNLARQEAAWPTREQDQLREMAPPLAVRQLQAKSDQLYKRKEGLLWRLRSAGSQEVKLLRSSRNEPPVDVAPVLEELKTAESLTLLEGLVPAAGEIGREDARTPDALMALADRLEPCPSFVVRALADLEHEDSGFFLLQLGTQARSVPILQAAGECGQPSVLGKLIELVEGGDSELGAKALRALNRLDARFGSKRLEFKTLITERLWSARSAGLKVALISHLGHLRDPGTYTVLETSYELGQDESVRLAVLGAMGQIGEPGAKFLLERLRNTGNSLAVRRACVNSLGTADHRAAVPRLVELLNDLELKEDAWRSLRRIAGRDLGVHKTPWLRWWATQSGKSAAMSEEQKRE